MSLSVMKVTDAKWELKNLGLRVCELEFAADEVIPAGGVIPGTEAFDYIVAKVPAGNTRAAHRLEEIGYRYLENQVNISFSAKHLLRIDNDWIRKFESVECREISSDKEYREIVKRTRQGLFERDRFSIDPLIDKSLPDNRIANWIEDLMGRDNCSFFSIGRGPDPAGYFILENRGRSVYITMAGVFREYQGKGYSFLLLYHILRVCAERGSDRITASVSINNLKTINTFTRFINFMINEVFMVFRKYNLQKKRIDVGQ